MVNYWFHEILLQLVGRWITRETSRGLGRSLTRFGPVLVLIIESGLVISVTKIVEFILYVQAPDQPQSGNNAIYIVFESVPQILASPTFLQ